jgi:hypothetical protein
MKRLILCLAVSLMVFATASYAPEAHASRGFSVLTDYWTSPSVHNGYTFLPCSGSLQTSGTLSGEWKEIQYASCTSNDLEYDVYHYCNGTWVQVAYLGDPSC